MKAASQLRALVAVLLVAAAGSAFTQDSGPRVVASTSWTAAFARAAGASSVTVIAPFELRHPPEYEIKPSDLLAVSGAALVVHSGYERFATRLAETADAAGVGLHQVWTDNVPATFVAEARKLAGALGTVPAFEAWEPGFLAMSEAMRDRVRAAWPDRRAAVHRYLAEYAKWLGFEVVAVFGPGEPSPALLLELARAKPALIIDNVHNPSGEAASLALEAPRVVLRNFPAPGSDGSIESVFAANEAAFLAAAAGR
ncbi:MAG: ABC transporter substrate-binding protein [Spirochaetales bacterium]|nr:ABC transporter substrate-binding protein [Spirochaetales bacterium]